MKRANARLESSIYDGRSRNWTWTKHVAMLRECFKDLEDSDEQNRNALSQAMQVEKLVNSYQYQPLLYLTTTINNDPRYNNNFNAAVGFITTEMANIKNRNGPKPTAINISGISTAADDEDVDEYAQSNKLAQMKRKVKQLQAKLKKKDGDKLPAFKKNAKAKYNKSNPTVWLKDDAFKALTPEQKSAVLEARKKAGIQSKRGVRALATANVSKVAKKPESQADEELPQVSNDPKSLKVLKAVPVSLLKAPKRGQGLVTTQRAALYSASTRRVSFSPKTKAAPKESKPKDE